MVQPLLFLIGLAGAAFMIYAFHVMKLLNRTARILAISGLMLAVILFGNRMLTPGQVRTAPNSLPFVNRPSSSPQAMRGWQETPFIVLELILSEISSGIGELDPPDLPASPSPSPSLSPLPSPVQPAPSPSLTPPQSQPSPSPTPDPYPDRYPDNPYSNNPYPNDPYPYPVEPAPTPIDPVQPDPVLPDPDPDFEQPDPPYPDRYPDRPSPNQPAPYEPPSARPQPKPIPAWW